MADHHHALGVDLNELYVVAHDLTEVAQNFAQASDLVSSCTTPDVSPPWMDIHPAWSELRFCAFDILYDTHTNLVDTAKTLNQNANDYAAADHEAAITFRKLIREDQQQPGW